MKKCKSSRKQITKNLSARQNRYKLLKNLDSSSSFQHKVSIRISTGCSVCGSEGSSAEGENPSTVSKGIFYRKYSEYFHLIYLDSFLVQFYIDGWVMRPTKTVFQKNYPKRKLIHVIQKYFLKKYNWYLACEYYFNSCYTKPAAR